jgi:hypothetical protein
MDVGQQADASNITGADCCKSLDRQMVTRTGYTQYQ